MMDVIDFSKWSDTLPPEKEFIVQDWLSVGDVSYISGGYKTGKSLLAQQLMTAATTGKSWLGIDVKQVKTYGLFCEDEKEDLICKQHAINKLYQLGSNSSDLADNMRLLSRAGKDNLLIAFDNWNIGKPTPFFYDLLEDVKAFQPKLVVLDSALELFEENEEIRIRRRQFMKCCFRIAKTANCAVVLCQHDTRIEMWHNRVLYLSSPEEGSNKRILHNWKFTYSLCYKDGVFVN